MKALACELDTNTLSVQAHDIHRQIDVTDQQSQLKFIEMSNSKPTKRMIAVNMIAGARDCIRNRVKAVWGTDFMPMCAVMPMAAAICRLM